MWMPTAGERSLENPVHTYDPTLTTLGDRRLCFFVEKHEDQGGWKAHFFKGQLARPAYSPSTEPTMLHYSRYLREGPCNARRPTMRSRI